ncbi:hypothetical protein LR48_Vigan04g126500 [Vigna angularis]|uniref:Uncharacterized protein n=1 Tax=Phaseolus angularis TaxID=3914 RepID=A0A0L9UEU9_PHAAN|nr:hypothetical protein LR48_Vigan04g126500 [Vigna angularis]
MSNHPVSTLNVRHTGTDVQRADMGSLVQPCERPSQVETDVYNLMNVRFDLGRTFKDVEGNEQNVQRADMGCLVQPFEHPSQDETDVYNVVNVRLDQGRTFKADRGTDVHNSMNVCPRPRTDVHRAYMSSPYSAHYERPSRPRKDVLRPAGYL